MSATIRLPHGVEATVDGYAWSCADPAILELLNTTLRPGGPGGEDPHPDLTLAREAARRFGGAVVRFDPPDRLNPDLVY